MGRKFAGQIIYILNLILAASKDNEKCVIWEQISVDDRYTYTHIIIPN